MYSNSLDHQNTLSLFLLFPFYRRGNWGWENWSTLFWVSWGKWFKLKIVRIQGAEKPYPTYLFASLLTSYKNFLLPGSRTFILPCSLTSPGTRTNYRYLSPETHWLPQETEVRFRGEKKYFYLRSLRGLIREGKRREAPVMARLPSPHLVHF